MALAWERRYNEFGHPLETVKAFRAFTAYRELGADRSLAKLAQQLGKSVKLYERWSKTHSWQQRIDAWEQNVFAERSQEFDRETQEMATRHARAAMAMQARALQRLQGLNVEDLSGRDVGYLMDVATKIERLARGQPSERIELMNSVLTPLIQQLTAIFLEVNTIPDEELRRLHFAERADDVLEGIITRYVPA